MATIINDSGLVFPDGSTQTSAIPSGTIFLWYGSLASIPSGWKLCDGTNSTPDLRDKFIIGAGNVYSIGSTGGCKDSVLISHTHTATVSPAGSHEHISCITCTCHTHSLSSMTCEGAHRHNFSFKNRDNNCYASLANAGSHSHEIRAQDLSMPLQPEFDSPSGSNGSHWHYIGTPQDGPAISAVNHRHTVSYPSGSVISTHPSGFVDHKHCSGYTGLVCSGTVPGGLCIFSEINPNPFNPVCRDCYVFPQGVGTAALTDASGVHSHQVSLGSTTQFPYDPQTNPYYCGTHTHNVIMQPHIHNHCICGACAFAMTQCENFCDGGSCCYFNISLPWRTREITSSNICHFHCIDILYVSSNNCHIHCLYQSDPAVVTTVQAGTHSHSINMSPAGVSTTNANLPPFYALAFLMKI